MPELIPPDLKRCQAEHPNGCSAWTVGGVPALVRCINKPTFIVAEKKPGKDGLQGSMALCNSCLATFNKQEPEVFAGCSILPIGEQGES